MTVSRRSDGTIVLEGTCPVEDAEPLLQMLLATPAAPVDWTHAITCIRRSCRSSWPPGPHSPDPAAMLGSSSGWKSPDPSLT